MFPPGIDVRQTSTSGDQTSRGRASDFDTDDPMSGLHRVGNLITRPNKKGASTETPFPKS